MEQTFDRQFDQDIGSQGEFLRHAWVNWLYNEARITCTWGKRKSSTKCFSWLQCNLLHRRLNQDMHRLSRELLKHTTLNWPYNEDEWRAFKPKWKPSIKCFSWLQDNSLESSQKFLTPLGRRENIYMASWKKLQSTIRSRHRLLRDLLRHTWVNWPY